METIKLYNGTELPDLCFGSGITSIHSSGIIRGIQRMKCLIKIAAGRGRGLATLNYHLPQIIEICMQENCRMFDTSRAYGASEYILGQTLKKYKRNEYKIVTKLGNKDQFTSNVRGGFEKSLSELGMEYVDLYLMHWPVEGHYIESWKVMENLYKEGKCKAIGVCNCHIHHLEELRKSTDIKPMVNEIECHPLFTQNELRDYCKEERIQIMAYTSTARMDERLRKTCLVPLSKKYNKSVAQIILKWHQTIGNIPIVNSSNPKHMMQNCQIYDFDLSEEEIKSISSININSRLRYDPDNCDFTQL